MDNSIIYFVCAVLLSYSHVSTFFVVYPRVSRTSDAIIIDLAGVAFDSFLHGISDPRFISVPYPIGQFMDYNWSVAQCGKGATATPTFRSSISERIAGGMDAKKHIWTFMVAINYASGFFCSGTLLSDTKVLSAASCFEKMSLYEMSTLTVSVGGYRLDQSDAQMTRRVSRIVIHGQYNSATYANDIAIVTLDMPVTFSKTVGPVCLPPASSDPDDSAGQDAIILGWGAAPTATCSTSEYLGSCPNMCASVTSTGGIVQSPNFPGDYGNNNNHCGITITASVGSTIKLQFTTFNLRKVDFINVYDGNPDTGFTMLKIGLTGNTIPSAYTTTTNGIKIELGFSKNPNPSAITYNWQATFTVQNSRTAPATLQQALTSIGYNVDCRNDPNFGKYVTNSTTCINSNVFTCPKDVGGPVVINSAPNVQGTTAVWTQVAINSFTPGTDCTLGGVKSKVSAFRPWIDTFMV